MSLHFLPSPNIIDLGFGPGIHVNHVRAELENMAAGIARHQGEQAAMAIMAEAFAALFAGRAHDSGKPSLARFAFEHSLERSMAAEADSRVLARSPQA